MSGWRRLVLAWFDRGALVAAALLLAGQLAVAARDPQPAEAAGLPALVDGLVRYYETDAAAPALPPAPDASPSATRWRQRPSRPPPPARLGAPQAAELPVRGHPAAPAAPAAARRPRRGRPRRRSRLGRARGDATDAAPAGPRRPGTAAPGGGRIVDPGRDPGRARPSLDRPERAPSSRRRYRVVSRARLDREDPAVRAAGLTRAPAELEVRASGQVEARVPADLRLRLASVTPPRPLAQQAGSAQLAVERWDPSRGEFVRRWVQTEVGQPVAETTWTLVEVGVDRTAVAGRPRSVGWAVLRRGEDELRLREDP